MWIFRLCMHPLTPRPRMLDMPLSRRPSSIEVSSRPPIPFSGGKDMWRFVNSAPRSTSEIFEVVFVDSWIVGAPQRKVAGSIVFNVEKR
jgi:hypothetical protein